MLSLQKGKDEIKPLGGVAMNSRNQYPDVPLAGEHGIDKVAFGNKLRFLLDQKNKSQVELAEYLGVSEGTVSQWVHGVKFPRMGKLYRIADFLSVSPSYLLGMTNDPYASPARSYEEQEQDEIYAMRKELFRLTATADKAMMEKILSIVKTLMQ